MSALPSNLPIPIPQSPSPSLSSPSSSLSTQSSQSFVDLQERLSSSSTSSSSSSSSSISLRERRISSLSSSFGNESDSSLGSICYSDSDSFPRPRIHSDREESKRPSASESSGLGLDRPTGRRSSDLTSSTIARTGARMSISQEMQDLMLVTARTPTPALRKFPFPNRITVGAVTVHVVLDTQGPSLPQESSSPVDKVREFTIRIPAGLNLSMIAAHQEDKGYPEVTWEGFKLYCELNANSKASLDDWQLLTNVDCAWKAYLRPKELRKKMIAACNINFVTAHSASTHELLEGRVQNILKLHKPMGTIKKLKVVDVEAYSEIEELLCIQECNNVTLTAAAKIDAYVTLLSRKIINYTPEQIRSRLTTGLPSFPDNALVHPASVVKTALGYRLAIQDDLWVIFYKSLWQCIQQIYENFDEKAEVPIEQMKFSIKLIKDVLRTCLDDSQMQDIPEVPADIKEEFIRAVSQDWTKKELECVVREGEGLDAYQKRLQRNGGRIELEESAIMEYLFDHLVKINDKEMSVHQIVERNDKEMSPSDHAQFGQALCKVSVELLSYLKSVHS